MSAAWFLLSAVAVGVLFAQALWYFPRWVKYLPLRVRSTPTHLVIERRHQVDWRAVRELEWNLDKRFYHTVDGEQIPDDDPRATEKEQAVRTPLEPYRESVEYRSTVLSATPKVIYTPGSLHRCRNCGTAENLWESSVDGHWRCHKRGCQPCWCAYCNGRIGVHNEDAVVLYYDQVEAAIKALTNKGIVS